MQKMSRKSIFVFILLVAILLLFPTFVQAADNDKKTYKQTVSGVEINFTYKLNDSNEVVDLVCTNPDKIKGEFKIPSEIDGNKVTEIGFGAFKNATGMTSVTIPKSLKSVATSGGGNNAVFNGCTNLKDVTLEEGLTIVPDELLRGLPIEEITIPNTVKEIGDCAFADCTSLKKINLGQVEELHAHSFLNCTGLTNITIPKSLKSVKATSVLQEGVFNGCTNLKDVTLEEGLTIVPDELLRGLPIEEITIPNTVKEIGDCAFADCTSLKKINLGQVEELHAHSFLNCTGLTNITIPKSLKSVKATSVLQEGVFNGCTNLKDVTLEEGLTIVPDELLRGLPIEEIIIPNTVKEIGNLAFADCSNLKKITILDNVTKIDDYAFKNHSDDLTIYCYKDSVADVYGAEKSIKRVYLTRPSNPTTPSDDEDKGTDNNNNAGSNVNDNNSGNNNDNGNNNNSNTNGSVQGVSKDDDDDKKTSTSSSSSSSKNTTTGKKDNTVSPTILPQTGLGRGIMVIVIIATVYGIYAYRKYNYLKDIK